MVPGRGSSDCAPIFLAAAALELAAFFKSFPWSVVNLQVIKRAIARIPVFGPSLRVWYWQYLERRRQAAARKPASNLDFTVKPDPDFLRSLGYEFEPPPRPRPTPPPPNVAPPLWPAEDVYFVTVCSMNHVPFARTLLESITRQHGAVPCVVTVVDAPARDAVAIDGAIVLTGRDVFASELDYAALKFDASELCCAAKAYMIDYLLLHSPAQRFVYIDSDIYLFSRLDAMLAKLDEADFVVTPHTVAPLPAPERFWEKPSLGDLAFAGVFNAGMFAMRRSDDSARFIATWKWLVTSVGAFVKDQGGQAEQHAFNWISCWAESFAVLRDTAYNVAYWNLHDRSLRYLGGINGEPRWTVDGKPLVAFHFSGYSPSRPFQFSRHENRYLFHLLPAVARLRDFFVDRLEANDRGELDTRYRFDWFPSGIRIDALMREIFRTHEVFLRAGVSPWTPEGEAYYARALLSPIPYTGSFTPILVKTIQDRRPDLQAFGEWFDPAPIMSWMSATGAREHDYEELFDRYRVVVPAHSGAVLLAALCKKWPRLFEGLHDALRSRRQEFIARVQEVAPFEAQLIQDGGTEFFISTGVGSVRRFVQQRPDLREAFPDMLYDDAPRFVQWLREKRMDEHFLPASAIDAFAARTSGASLARVFSYVSRTWPLMEMWPLALAGEFSRDLARTLVGGLRHSIEYDAEDIEMYLWTMQEKPWAGLGLTLELPIHSTRHPSSRSRQGQNEILGSLLRDRRFAIALDAYRRRYPLVEDKAPPSRLTAKDVTMYSVIGQPRRPQRVPPQRIAPGVNVFGYQRSDIGLGQMTRGLVQALKTTGCSTSDIPLGNLRMDNDLRPEDFIRRYDVAKGTNVFISYPQYHDVLLRTIPDEVTQRHRNIAYLAWEQRDGSHYWEDVYAEYDQVWALSDFAAESLTEILQRTVRSVPCVVDMSLFPPPSPKEGHGIDPRVFTILFVYDANSSTERKNPEAVVKAFRMAFRADDCARLVIKASSANQVGNRARLQRLLAAIDSHPDIEVRVEDLSRNDLYGLISASDCYISLHRGEGFGYTCAEAMVYAKPVIATGYSGNLQFMTDENSYPTRYREVEANVQEVPFQRGSLWAEPDVAHAAELMRHIYENRDEAAARGELGRRTIEEQLSPEAIGARVHALLSDGEGALDRAAEGVSLAGAR